MLGKDTNSQTLYPEGKKRCDDKMAGRTYIMPVTFGGAGSRIKAISILFPNMGCQRTLNLIVTFAESGAL